MPRDSSRGTSGFFCVSCIADLDFAAISERRKSAVAAAEASAAEALEQARRLSTRAALAESELAASRAQDQRRVQEMAKALSELAAIRAKEQRREQIDTEARASIDKIAKAREAAVSAGQR